MSITTPRSFWAGNTSRKLRGSCYLLVLLLAGCGAESTPSGEVLDENWFSTRQEAGDRNREQEAPDAPPTQSVSKATLGVNLQAGDKFPLQKVVEKTLIQTMPHGKIESTERVELMMSITVEEIRQQNKKFRILYTRVAYNSDINGQKTEYDSQNPPHSVPDAALAYHGMVNNGFSFWVGADNKITDVVDFQQFLQRCLANIPEHKADGVAQVLAGHSGQEGIANFVDDTIGLLPYDPESTGGNNVVRLGGNWSKSRHFNDPVPMSLNNTYTLRELTDDIAQIEITGDIVPAAAVSSTPAQDLSLQIRHGHTSGTCTIDRHTGLPLNSRIDHQLAMSVQSEGLQFQQDKRVVTSIRMFPSQRADSEPQPLELNPDAQGPTADAGGQDGGRLRLRPVTHSPSRN